MCVEGLQYLRWRVVAAGRVLHGDRQQLADRAIGGEGHRGLDDLEVHLAADEAPIDVRQQRAGQQAGLAQHLEAVADPEHEPALCEKRMTDSITGEKRAIAPTRR